MTVVLFRRANCPELSGCLLDVKCNIRQKFNSLVHGNGLGHIFSLSRKQLFKIRMLALEMLFHVWLRAPRVTVPDLDPKI